MTHFEILLIIFVNIGIYLQIIITYEHFSFHLFSVILSLFHVKFTRLRFYKRKILQNYCTYFFWLIPNSFQLKKIAKTIFEICEDL